MAFPIDYFKEGNGGSSYSDNRKGEKKKNNIRFPAKLKGVVPHERLCLGRNGAVVGGNGGVDDGGLFLFFWAEKERNRTDRVSLVCWWAVSRAFNGASDPHLASTAATEREV